MKVLVTGGAGYIGSTICSALEDAGHEPVVLDNLYKGRKEFVKGKKFYQGDIADRSLLTRIFKENPDIYATIHCAALIIVPESVANPSSYYHENVSKSLELFTILRDLSYSKIVFSSSASIYDVSPNYMVTEDSALRPSSPYARTKYMMEMILQDMANAYGMYGLALRYFNPIGADPKLRSGMYDLTPSHVLGKMLQVAVGNDKEFTITGTHWDTRDGTGIRDYIHVWDLAVAHVKAVENFSTIFNNSKSNYEVINLGTGNGVTVKELVTAFESVFGKTLPKRESEPRPGDVAGAYANCSKAKQLLNWSVTNSTEQAISDALRWQQYRPQLLNY